MTDQIDTNIQDKAIRWNKLVSRCEKYAKPLATRVQTKKIFKLINKSKPLKCLRLGIKEIQKSLRKGEKGFVILAGDVTPIDVISHLPLLCENNRIPYCYVPSKEDLGLATGSRRQTCGIMVKDSDQNKHLYKECYDAIKKMSIPL